MSKAGRSEQDAITSFTSGVVLNCCLQSFPAFKEQLTDKYEQIKHLRV